MIFFDLTTQPCPAKTSGASVTAAVAGAYLAFVVAGVVLLVLLLTRRVRRHTSVAFGPYLVAGALLAALLAVRPLGG